METKASEKEKRCQTTSIIFKTSKKGERIMSKEIIVWLKESDGTDIYHELRKSGFVVHMASFHDLQKSAVFIDNKVLDIEETRLYLHKLKEREQ